MRNKRIRQLKKFKDNGLLRDQAADSLSVTVEERLDERDAEIKEKRNELILQMFAFEKQLVKI